MNKVYEFIKKLRESEEHIKRRWLVLISGVLMVFIVFFWMKYFNSLVEPMDAPQPAEQSAGQGFTFWETFKSGLGAILETAGKTLSSFMNMISQPKNYDITPGK